MQAHTHTHTHAAPPPQHTLHPAAPCYSCRYVARKYKLDGKDEKEKCAVDMIMEGLEVCMSVCALQDT